MNKLIVQIDNTVKQLGLTKVVDYVLSKVIPSTSAKACTGYIYCGQFFEQCSNTCTNGTREVCYGNIKKYKPYENVGCVISCVQDCQTCTYQPC